MVHEYEIPRRSSTCMTCGVSFKEKSVGASFLKIYTHSVERVDLCEECSQKRVKKETSALWQWSKKEVESPDEKISLQSLVELLFSTEATLSPQEKFVLAHVLKRGRAIRQRSKTREHLTVESLDKKKKLTLPIPHNVFCEEAFSTVQKLFEESQ